jgi:hypothetical protein
MIYDNQVKNLVSNLMHKFKNNTNSLYDYEPLKLNIILEGGGFNGLYEYGCLLLLREMENQKLIKINKISGASIGGVLGFLYLSDLLDDYIHMYEEVREYWKEHNNLLIVKKKILELFEKIERTERTSGKKRNTEKKVKDNNKDKDKNKDNNNILSKINNRLYLSYYQLERKKQIIQSSYKDLEDIKQGVLQTSHLPVVINNEFCENNQFIDGGYPYIFSQRDLSSSEKTLYISINNMSKLQNVLRVKEHNSSARILEGILQCYEIFYTGEKNGMCSFIHQWNKFDYILLRIKQVLILIIVYIISFFHKIYIAFELAGKQTDINIENKMIHNKDINSLVLNIIKYINNNHFFHKLLYIMHEIYRDFVLSYCF